MGQFAQSHRKTAQKMTLNSRPAGRERKKEGRAGDVTPFRLCRLQRHREDGPSPGDSLISVANSCSSVRQTLWDAILLTPQISASIRLCGAGNKSVLSH